MRVFTSTKILLFFTFLAANLGPPKMASAQSCPDPNCCKTCGAVQNVQSWTRSCNGGTCWITLCYFHSNYCVGYTDNYNDICSPTSQADFCEPD